MAKASSTLAASADCHTAPEVFHGQACQRLTLPCGDSVLVALQGAHVLSWVSQGRERLFLSDRNVWDGQAAIRGGVPVCFPQFNQRGHLPKHGFARNLAWQCTTAQDFETVAIAQPNSPKPEPTPLNTSAAHLCFELTANAQTLRLWPQHFVATLRVSLAPAQLQIGLQVRNTDSQPLSFTGALHTYLAVQDIAHTALSGLHGQDEWDAVTDQHGKAAQVLRFEGEFDRVYQAAPHALLVQDALGALRIEQSASWGQSVVWNPGAVKCATLQDMPLGGERHMLCVEAAQVYTPITLAPATLWQGWQRLSLV